MRVICIESSTSRDPGAILVHKDSIYNTVDIENSPEKHWKGNSLYYQLLETAHWWHSCLLFREIDDIPEEEEEIKEELVEQL